MYPLTVSSHTSRDRANYPYRSLTAVTVKNRGNIAWDSCVHREKNAHTNTPSRIINNNNNDVRHVFFFLHFFLQFRRMPKKRNVLGNYCRYIRKNIRIKNVLLTIFKYYNNNCKLRLSFNFGFNNNSVICATTRGDETTYWTYSDGTRLVKFREIFFFNNIFKQYSFIIDYHFQINKTIQVYFRNPSASIMNLDWIF